MALKIRLSRGGAKKRPYYRIVVTDARSPRDGSFIEKVGSYNPMVAKDSDQRVILNVERIQHWLGNGAQPTDRVLRFLDKAGLATRTIPAQTKKAEQSEKTKMRIEEKAEKARAAAEAAAEAAAAPAEA